MMIMTAEPAEFVIGPPVGRKHRLRVSPGEMEYDGTAMALADVDHMACYHVAHTVRAVGVKVGPAALAAQYWLAGGGRELAIDLPAGGLKAGKERLAAAVDALDSALAEAVLPRLVGQAAARIHAGETVTAGGRNVIVPVRNKGVGRIAPRPPAPGTLDLGPGGITLHAGRKSQGPWAWQDITGAVLSNGELWLKTTGGNAKLLPLIALDAYIVPAIISTVQDA
jgi:hypothetical protein